MRATISVSWMNRVGGFLPAIPSGCLTVRLDTDNGEFVFPTTTPVQFDPEALHASINRLVDLHPKVLYLTHFGRITGIERAARQMHDLIDRFVTMAQALGGAGTERHARLIQGQREILWPRLRARLPPRRRSAWTAARHGPGTQRPGAGRVARSRQPIVVRRAAPVGAADVLCA